MLRQRKKNTFHKCFLRTFLCFVPKLIPRIAQSEIICRFMNLARSRNFHRAFSMSFSSPKALASPADNEPTTFPPLRPKPARRIFSAPKWHFLLWSGFRDDIFVLQSSARKVKVYKKFFFFLI